MKNQSYFQFNQIASNLKRDFYIFGGILCFVYAFITKNPVFRGVLIEQNHGKNIQINKIDLFMLL